MKAGVRCCAGTVLACGLLLSGAAHALTQTRNPTTCVNDASIGTSAWSNPGNALVSDAARASAVVVGAGTTNYLRCTGYGFTIPPGARIDGILVNVERMTSATTAGGSQDAAVRVVQGGVIGVVDQSTTNTYTLADVNEAHGATTPLWGLTWAYTDINAGNFGAAVAAQKNNPAQTHTLSINSVSITVDYTPAPVVVSINRAGANPTTAATVDWTVTFSEAVSGVDTSDFALAVSGLSGTSIISVTGGPTAYTVTANTGAGTGTLGLNLVDNDTIVNAATLPLAGSVTLDGGFTGQQYNVSRPSVANFNVVEPGANALTGRIFTKIAGQAIAVDIVALDASNAISTGFTDTVAVELVDNTSGGACAGLPLIKALANQTFVAGDNGRHPLGAGQFEAEAWRNVRFRIKYPVASPTVIACSSDAFANRPAAFQSLEARHLNRTTAGVGVGPLLTNTANPPSIEVHNAGRPFRIAATAQNASGVTMALYAPDAGQPVAVLAQCGSGTAACLPGPVQTDLTLGAWSVAAGVITTTTASYANVGAFDLVLQDETFALIDLADGTANAVRYISSAPLTVGRFVPDHFAITGASVTPRSDIVACAASTFTYMGERMDLVFTLRARAFGGADTPGYAGVLAPLPLNAAASYNFGAIDAAAPTPLNGARLDLSLIPGIAGAWAGGVAAIAAPIAINRAAAPDGPYDSVRIGIAPSDLDGVTLATLDLDADNSGSNERGQLATTRLRFGRLRLDNAVGSQTLDLPIPIRLEYWAGTAFVTNTADTCTTISTANIGLSNYDGGITNANVTAANLAPVTVVFSGTGSLTVTRPLPAPAAPGAVTLTVDLTAEAKSYLKGNWGVTTFTADPRSRAAFGLYGSQPNNFIYFRENY